MIGYKRPDQYDKDDPVFDVLSIILSSGRTGLLYKDMVEEKRLSLAAQGVPTYPDGALSEPVRVFAGAGAGTHVGRERARHSTRC